VEKVGPEKYKCKFVERPRHEWIAVPIPVLPGLDRATVERARSQISGNVRPASSGTRGWELSGGLLYCSHCGRRMRGHNAQTRGKGGVKRPIFYYVCPRKLPACENRYHRAEDLEETVMEAVSTLLSHPTAPFRQIEEKLEAERRLAGDSRRELAALGRRLDELTAVRWRYLDPYAEGVIQRRAQGPSLVRGALSAIIGQLVSKEKADG